MYESYQVFEPVGVGEEVVLVGDFDTLEEAEASADQNPARSIEQRQGGVTTVLRLARKGL